MIKHKDKYISNVTGMTKVGFYTDGILREVRYYNHLEGEWNKRIQEENDWCNVAPNNRTKFIN